MAQKLNVRPRFWIILAIIMVMVFAVIYWGESRIIQSQQSQIADLQLAQEQAVRENVELERKIAFSKTDEYVERTARADLGLLKPDEVRYVQGTGLQN